MITKTDTESTASLEEYKVASVLFLLCFHLTALAVALLIGKSQSLRQEQ